MRKESQLLMAHLRPFMNGEATVSVGNLFYRKSYHRLCEGGLRVLAVKNLICRVLYPKPVRRIFGDGDLFVCGKDYMQCQQVNLKKGLQSDSKNRLEENGVVSYYGRQSSPHIVLHQQLFSEQSETYGDFNRMFKHSAESCAMQDVSGSPVLTTNHAGHMLFLICHSMKQFSILASISVRSVIRSYLQMHIVLPLAVFCHGGQAGKTFRGDAA